MHGKRRYGEIGEEYARDLLKTKGYQIIERNFKNKLGEIDIVAIDPSTRSAKAQGRLEHSRKATGSGPGGTLVFIEVKTRWSKRYGKPEEAVTAKKLAKIKRVGVAYSQLHPALPKEMRIDVVAIEVEKGRVSSAKIIKVD